MAKRKTDFSFQVLDALLQRACTAIDAAHIMDCSVDTIERRVQAEHEMSFKEYRNSKMATTRAKLCETALSKAFKGDNVMLIFCLKNLCKWSDKNEVEIDAKSESRLIIDYGKDEESA